MPTSDEPTINTIRSAKRNKKRSLSHEAESDANKNVTTEAINDVDDGETSIQNKVKHKSTEQTKPTSNKEIHRGRLGRPVAMIDLQTGAIVRLFSSQTTAVESWKINVSPISQCCTNKRDQVHGFKWQFYDGDVKDCKYLSY